MLRISISLKKGLAEFGLLSTLAAGALYGIGCAKGSAKSPDVSGEVRRALNRSGFKNVKVSEDRDLWLVTLGGQVGTEDEKSEAQSIAKSIANPQVVSAEIAVVPPDATDETKAANKDLDTAIEKNLDAALLEQRLKPGVSYAVKNQAVILKGEVGSPGKRVRVQSVAASVPNVKQVVNEIQVKDQKATSSGE
jgi:hyperosmotically inducible protein